MGPAAQMHAIFGYGSLINAPSRARSFCGSQAHVVRLKGFRRGWYLPVPKERACGLGVVRHPDHVCNGVLVELPQAQLAAADARELPHGYRRVSVDPDHFQPLRGDPIPDLPCWIYDLPRAGAPSSASPIIQSYVDVVLEGCLDIGQDFAAEFIRTTDGWGGCWVDDRLRARYQRQDPPRDGGAAVDALLRRWVPGGMGGRIVANH